MTFVYFIRIASVSDTRETIEQAVVIWNVGIHAAGEECWIEAATWCRIRGRPTNVRGTICKEMTYQQKLYLPT